MQKKIFIGMCLTQSLFLAVAGALFMVFPNRVEFLFLAMPVFFLAAYVVAQNIGKFYSRLNLDESDIAQDYDDLAENISAILSNVPDGFILINQFGAIVVANPRARAIFNVADIEESEDEDRNNINFFTKNSNFLDKVKAALQGHGGQLVLDMGEIYQASFIPAGDKGVLILVSDITERQLVEKVNREFSANVVHELNDPIACIAGFADIICKGDSNNDDIIHFSNKIKLESQRMLALMESIILISRFDEKNGKDYFKDFNITKSAAEAMEKFRSTAKEKQVSMVLAAEAPVVLSGNRQLAYILFSNLISNAVRFSQPQGEVKVALSKKANYIYITVTDTGIGIAKEDQYKIFDRFYSTDSGSGLGLSIVKYIVRYHGGSIEIESEPNEGTRVYVKLPRE